MTKTTTRWLGKAAVLAVCLTVVAGLVLAALTDEAEAKKKRKNRPQGGGNTAVVGPQGPQGPPGSGGNADTLDGKDSSEFLGAGAKAADADKLDGKDSGAFFSGKTYQVSQSGVFTGGGGTLARALPPNCDSGDKMIGGGGIGGNEDDLVGSEPVGNVQFAITVRDNGPGSTITATGLCADFPPLRSQSSAAGSSEQSQEEQSAESSQESQEEEGTEPSEQPEQ